MTANPGWSLETSPFHAGEIAVQERVGVAEKMANLGPKVLRSYLTEELRAFYQSLPLVYVGHVDDRGRPWASVLTGDPGFIGSPEPDVLTLNATALPGDPLAGALVEGAPLGLVGVGIGNRRRNRVNGHIAAIGPEGVTLAVDQAFGNCPQYIRPREIGRTTPEARTGSASRLTSLDAAATRLISRSESFYVASWSGGDDAEAKTNGADVSHRGGKPGFVKVDDNVLTIPDFAGNLHFNTFGNFERHPRAGLLFIDWQSGEALSLTGTVEMIWDGPEVDAFKGAERLWRLSIEEGVRLPEAVAPGWSEGDASPNSLITGDWDEAAATLAAEAKRQAWRPYRVAAVRDESSVIRSFEFEPSDGDGLFRYKPGQHLTIQVPAGPNGAQVVRSYTLSSAPSDTRYRISVKREAEGEVSAWLHANLTEGDVIDARAPSGAFHLDTAERRPAVLVAAGVGVTPMISMTREVVNEGLRTRHTRPLTVVHAARNGAERAFAADFTRLAEESGGKIRFVSVLSRPEAGDAPDATGRIDAVLLRELLALDDYDFFLCGPGAFMQDVYGALRALGVRDARIFAETFGPSSLTRVPDAGTAPIETVPEAEEAVVVFAQSGFEQPWSKGDAPILELAEAHGLQPPFGCRSGTCGTCATPIKSGETTYRTQPTVDVADGNILICCAVPAEGTGPIELDL